jgi:large subunit ribosomal protein L3
MKAIIGRKMGMTQVFAEDGTVYPVTVVEVLPNVITQIKTTAKEGYDAVQIGYEDVKESRLNNPKKGVFKKANVAFKKELFEIPVVDIAAVKVGDALNAGIFQVGDVVDVTGTSKGKGFSGSIKRWHFTISPKSHGSGYPHRGPGSMATSGRTNNRVHPGKKMAGHHGNEQATVINLLVVGVNVEKNAILVRGGIPGPRKGLVMLRAAVKVQLGKPMVAKKLVSTMSGAK